MKNLFNQLNESERQTILKMHNLIEQTLEPNQLSSPKAQQTKKFQEIFNKKYNANIPVDGNWLNPKYNEFMSKYITEKGLTPYVCKKGDGYCNDTDAGEVNVYGEENIKKLNNFLSLEMSGAKINTTNDKSYDYKLENGKYYYSVKGQNKWIEAKGKGLQAIKTRVKF